MKVAATVTDLHIKALFDLPEMLIELAAEIGKPSVVVGDKAQIGIAALTGHICFRILSPPGRPR